MTTSGDTRTSSFGWRWFSRGLRGIRVAATAVAAALYPPECAACGRSAAWGEIVCPACERQLPRLTGPRCVRCGDALDDERLDLCLRCGTRQRMFDRVVSLGPYERGWESLVGAFKFGHEAAIGRWLAERLAARLTEAAEEIGPLAWVTHVPMTRGERAARGGNPSRALARWVARRLGVPERTLLGKVRSTRPQRTLPARERAVNLSDAFLLVRPGEGSVLLVDDILTTGATADECARVLKGGGYDEVHVLTVARA